MTGLYRREFDAAARGALEGVRVVDLSRLVAGNVLSLVLADHGAEVLKVEPPAGDTLRAWKVKGVETSWKTLCRNKASLCLDFRAPAGIALIRALCADAALLVESFRPGVLEEMGLAPADLMAANPRLVVLRISGWGQDGPYRHRPGFGTMVESYAGFAAQNGFEDREPVLPPMFLADAYAGLYGVGAAMIALRHAEATGQGQVIDLSLFDPLFAVLEPQVANFRLTGKVKPRTGSRSTNTAPRNVYRTRDGGWVGLSASTQPTFVKLMKSLEREDLLADPRFRSNTERIANIEAIDGVVRDHVAKLTMAEALAQFDRDGVTIGPVLNVEDISKDAYVRERRSLIEVPDAEMPGGWLPMHGEVPRLSLTPGILRRPAPRLGQDNRAVLSPLVGEAEFERLRAVGVVQGEG